MSATLVICVAAIGFNPDRSAAVDQVDLVEINHFHDEQGRLVFNQIIFYDWCPAESRYNVRAWRLLKHDSQVPLRNWRDGEFTTLWRDFKDRDALRKVRARMVRETWTQYDPELVEREFLPQEKRRQLTATSHVARTPRTSRSSRPRVAPTRSRARSQPSTGSASASN